MTTQPLSVVIVDRLGRFGYGLRHLLPWHQISAHVFHSYAPALLLMKAKVVDAVLMRFDVDPDTNAFLEEAKEIGISVIFTDSLNEWGGEPFEATRVVSDIARRAAAISK